MISCGTFQRHHPIVTIRGVSFHSSHEDDGLTSNIMSLGIAIAVGHVDAATWWWSRLTRTRRMGTNGRKRTITGGDRRGQGVAVRFFALLVIAVAFCVLTLERRKRLFKPLAYTKTFSMIIAARWRSHSIRPCGCSSLMKNYEFGRWLARATNAVLVGKIHRKRHTPSARS